MVINPTWLTVNVFPMHVVSEQGVGMGMLLKAARVDARHPGSNPVARGGRPRICRAAAALAFASKATS